MRNVVVAENRVAASFASHFVGFVGGETVRQGQRTKSASTCAITAKDVWRSGEMTALESPGLLLL